MLTLAQVEKMLADAKTTKPVNVFTEDGWTSYENLPRSLVGGYIGRAGSITRSRKGRTTRKANGFRQYVPNWDENIIAYKP